MALGYMQTIATVAAFAWSAPCSYAEQATFAVAITLHSGTRGVTAAQLCPDGKPLESLRSLVQVYCPPIGAAEPNAQESKPDGSLTPAAVASPRREIIVSF